MLDGIEGPENFGGIDMTVRRSAFGRQVGSVETGDAGLHQRFVRTVRSGSPAQGAPVAPPMLLLWDIDGTLLAEQASHAHRAAVQAAIRSVYGVSHPAPVQARTCGKTDLQLGRELLQRLGHPARFFYERSAEFCSAAAREHAARCPPDLSEHVIAGIVTLLAELVARADVRLGLLTGNIRAIGELKLARAGLARFFAPALGSFGCDAEDRSSLPSIARARAGAPAMPHPRQRTLIIGDTPRDIVCARADRVSCVAVTTGYYTARQLRNADHIASTSTSLRDILIREISQQATEA